MIELRLCRSGDFESVVILLRQLWLDKTVDAVRLRPIYERALISSSKTYLCAIDENSIIGFGSLSLKEDLWPEGVVAFIDELVVDEKSRGKGIGKRLLDMLIATALEKRCCRIELVSAFYRKESHRFYERNGFETRAFVFSKLL